HLSLSVLVYCCIVNNRTSTHTPFTSVHRTIIVRAMRTLAIKRPVSCGLLDYSTPLNEPGDRRMLCMCLVVLPTTGCGFGRGFDPLVFCFALKERRSTHQHAEITSPAVGVSSL
ncbi:unnamed protein product, partial [Ectocarpus sp. 8 AP-2014]